MLSDQEKSKVKGFLEKYEKYFNFQDSNEFTENFSFICEDICKKCSIEEEKSSIVEDYVKTLYDTSEGEGLSFILSPGPTFTYTQSDQVQRFHY
jgi:hypothetical protein